MKELQWDPTSILIYYFLSAIMVGHSMTGFVHSTWSIQFSYRFFIIVKVTDGYQIQIHASTRKISTSIRKAILVHLPDSLPSELIDC